MSIKGQIAGLINFGLSFAGLAIVRNDAGLAPRSPNQDEFLRWMRFINPGMCPPRNVPLIKYCVDHLPSDSPIVEIGSFAGLSLNHITYFLRRTGRKNPVYSVDEWKFEGFQSGVTIGGSHVSFDEYRDHVRETYRRNVALFSGDRHPCHIELSSDAFFATWDAPISFVHIDGDHSYEQSSRDFENTDRHLEVGGFIIFDDSGNDSDFGCRHTARRAAKCGRYEIVAKYPNYCLRKIK
jgi:hypothetical protein